MYNPIELDQGKAHDILTWSNINLEELSNQCDVITVIGGDGTLFKAIHKRMSEEKPFFGINRGTMGFLMNPIKTPEDLIEAYKSLHFISLGVFNVLFETRNGDRFSDIAFNDVYFNTAPGTVCHGEIQGDRYERKKFRGDGIIISTPQGSTAYNKNAGGSVITLMYDQIALRTICSPAKCSIRDVISTQNLAVIFTRGTITAHADNRKVDDVVKATVWLHPNRVRLAFAKDYDFESVRYND